jgi:small neutral amino acid transporter SnatA (MarC family)
MKLPAQFLESTSLLMVLLNPFLMSIYLLDLIESLEDRVFRSILIRGALIATAVFCAFAAGGDATFSEFLQVRFASFLIFGGILFLIIGLRFALQGTATLVQLRGAPEHVAGSIAMPFMVGPGTVSASVLAGAQLPLAWAFLSIATAMLTIVCGLLILKLLHTRLKKRNAALLDRYVDVVGRASALLIGTIAVDMILKGLELCWPQALH